MVFLYGNASFIVDADAAGAYYRRKHRVLDSPAFDKEGKAQIVWIVLEQERGIMVLHCFVCGVYLFRTVLVVLWSGQISAFGMIAKNPNTWLMLAALPVNFFWVHCVFGEEYGWRYYLQPLMQKRFWYAGRSASARRRVGHLASAG